MKSLLHIISAIVLVSGVSFADNSNDIWCDVYGSVVVKDSPGLAGSFEINVYPAGGGTAIAWASGSMVGDIISQYETSAYQHTAAPYVDVECIVRNSQEQIIFQRVVEDVESVHYYIGAHVDFGFRALDGMESSTESAPVDQGCFSFGQSETWAGIKTQF
ncbi:MAG: hypothetical protein QUS11_04925 [Candidatus Fermentibacter sp.]|nr:hypothetical protein [Candidatus Fermentibacter sp.]